MACARSSKFWIRSWKPGDKAYSMPVASMDVSWTERKEAKLTKTETPGCFCTAYRGTNERRAANPKSVMRELPPLWWCRQASGPELLSAYTAERVGKNTDLKSRFELTASSVPQ